MRSTKNPPAIDALDMPDIEDIVTSIQNAHGFSTDYNVNWLRFVKL
jgi:hypothetical protein